ncbi:MAG TPA: DUF438 domain-containing protein, partial [Holophaga sp.]|nr:DUF438 domain-containing protein [Holophaga sp.]
MSELINNQSMRIQTLKEVILHLHRGEAPEAVKERLKGLVAEVDPAEIAAMEQQLMADGMSADEVRAMCDMHAEVLKEVSARPCPSMPLPPGHPVSQFRAENAALLEAAARVREAAAGLGALEDRSTPGEARLALLEALQPVMDVEKHYRRKEHLVFSVLERHGNTGPSKVMWGKDDEVRELLKATQLALREETLCGEELKILAATCLEPALAALEGMVYKEENILLPMCLGLFTEEEWGEIWSQSPEYGWCLVEPGNGYLPPAAVPDTTAVTLPGSQTVAFPSGSLSPAQLAAMFSTLPVDI